MDYDEISCHGCFWEGNCPENEKCKDYTPLDDSMELEEYAAALRDNAAVYAKLIWLFRGR